MSTIIIYVDIFSKPNNCKHHKCNRGTYTIYFSLCTTCIQSERTTNTYYAVQYNICMCKFRDRQMDREKWILRTGYYTQQSSSWPRTFDLIHVCSVYCTYNIYILLIVIKITSWKCVHVYRIIEMKHNYHILCLVFIAPCDFLQHILAYITFSPLLFR